MSMEGEFQSIETLLTHRTPFLFVDRLLAANEEKTVAEYHFTGKESFFQGHFPDYPVVPGVLLIEMMAQCGGAGLRQTGVLPAGAFFVLASIEKAKFRYQVRPGDTVEIEVANTRVSTLMIRQSGTVKVGDKLAAEATWMCIVGDHKRR